MKVYPLFPHFRYAVVGAGAVGLYYGAKLASHGRDVRFLLRSDYDHATRVGVQILSGEGDFSVRGPFFFQGLCLLTAKPTSQILSSAGLGARVRGLMAEVLRAASACGHPLPDDLPAALLEKTRGLGDYRPSTMIDFELGREIELEAIWGEPLRRGQAAGVQMPLLGELYKELREAVRRRVGVATSPKFSHP